MLNQGNWQKYSLYGLTLASDFPFTSRLEPAQSNPELKFNCQFEPPIHVNLSAMTPVYTNWMSAPTGHPIIALYRLDEVDVLHYEGQLDFYIWPDYIICHVLNTAYDHLIENSFLGLVMTYWMERAGMPTFHASAIIVDSGVIGFLATNYAGKSTLSAAFIRAGCPLLTDDVLAVKPIDNTYWGQPGYPQMRMWPEQVKLFFGNYESLPKVHPASAKRKLPIGPDGFGTFENRPHPLQALFLLERTENGINTNISLLPPSQTLFKLLKNTICSTLFHMLPNTIDRFETIGRLVQQIPVYSLSYPAGFEHLPKVCSEILELLDKVPSLKSNKINNTACY